MNKPFWVKKEFMKILPKSIIFSSVWINEGGRSQDNINSLSNLTRKKFKGKLGKKSKIAIERAVQALCIQTGWKSTYCKIQEKVVKYRVGFVTLTLPMPQRHSDEEIKNVCLNDFLTKIRNNHSCKNYIWKAESQKNGRIHFHISIDKYIHYGVIRKYWIASLEKLGYITEYGITHKNFYPPCTEIRSVRKVKNMGAYLAKYVSKSNVYRPISGRLWACSYALSKYKFPTIDLLHPYFTSIYKIVCDFATNTYKTDWFEALNVDIITIMTNATLEIRRFLEDAFKCSYSDLIARLNLTKSTQNVYSV